LHRYLAEFDFRYNTRTALGYNDFCAPNSHRRQAPHLSTALQAKSGRSQAKRFLEWREKQRPKPVRVRYWQSRKPPSGR
jgi:hypothetical protein